MGAIETEKNVVQLNLNCLPTQCPTSRLLGTSPIMQELKAQLLLYGPSDLPVLIEGETGTGKKLSASILHALSKHRNAPFIPLNMVCLPENLTVKQLLFHIKSNLISSSTTGPDTVQSLPCATLFLDCIDYMSPVLQAKLLHVLKELEDCSSSAQAQQIPDFRIIASSHQPISKLVKQGIFSSDLFYRLADIRIFMPALRERRRDTDELAKHFLQQQAKKDHKTPFRFSRAAKCKLLRIDLPGNVRQLRAIISHAAILAGPDNIIDEPQMTKVLATYDLSENTLHSAGLKAACDRFEYSIVLESYQKNQGNRAEMAKELHISLRTLYLKLKKHGLGGKDEPVNGVTFVRAASPILYDTFV